MISFPGGFKARYPNERNDHGVWNGLNLFGIDPRALCHPSKNKGKQFNLVNFIKNQNELCAVFVRKTDFSYLKRYFTLVEKNPLVEKRA